MNIECPTEVSPPAGLSEVDGGALSLPAGHPASLAEALEKTAREYPAHGVICLDGAGGVQEQNYPELLAEAARLLGGLRAVGLKPGEPVLFQLEKNPEFVAAFWACALGGFVPVPISIAPTYEEPHSVLSKLRNAWTMLGEPLTLAGSSLAPRLQAFAGREGLAGFRVETPEALRVHDLSPQSAGRPCPAPAHFRQHRSAQGGAPDPTQPSVLGGEHRRRLPVYSRRRIH